MFKNLFSRTQKTETVAVNPVVVPADEDYVLTEKQQKAFDALVADKDGFVHIGDVTHGLMNQQSQYITRYMDGSNSSIPVLVSDLRVDVSSSSHHEYRIHLEDVLEFVARVRAHRGR